MGCGGFEVWVISLGMGVDEFFFFILGVGYFMKFYCLVLIYSLVLYYGFYKKMIVSCVFFVGD